MLACDAILYVQYIEYVTSDKIVLNSLRSHFLNSSIIMLVCLLYNLYCPPLTEQNEAHDHLQVNVCLISIVDSHIQLPRSSFVSGNTEEYNNKNKQQTILILTCLVEVGEQNS